MKKVPSCIRTGMCCTSIPLLQSPKNLREMYEAAQTNTDVAHQILTVYPMLKDTCKGKLKKDFHYKTTYIYGPCKNLGYEIVGEKLLATCKINENKPPMCQDFPHNAPKEWNKGTFKGCGFNKGDQKDKKSARWPIKTQLLPLDVDEM